MVIAVALAGGAAYFYVKVQIEKDDFSRSIRLIAQDDDATWCKIANAPIIQDRNGLSYCAIAMPEYQAPNEGVSSEGSGQ